MASSVWRRECQPQCLGGRRPLCSEWRGQGSFRQSVPCPDLDCGTDCPTSLDGYLFAESYLAALVSILYATQYLSSYMCVCVCVLDGGGIGWMISCCCFFLPEFLLFPVLTDLGIRGRNQLGSISSVIQSCPTLCDPMDCSMPGFPVHHQLPKLAQTQVHRVGDAIQPSHPLSSPSLPASNPSQHQGLFQCVSSSHQVAKVL